MNNLAEVEEEVNEESLQDILKRVDDVSKNINRKIESFFCEKHQKFKTDLHHTGNMLCEVCFNADFHHAEFVGGGVYDAI